MNILTTFDISARNWAKYSRVIGL